MRKVLEACFYISLLGLYRTNDLLSEIFTLLLYIFSFIRFCLKNSIKLTKLQSERLKSVIYFCTNFHALYPLALSRHCIYSCFITSCFFFLLFHDSSLVLFQNLLVLPFPSASPLLLFCVFSFLAKLTLSHTRHCQVSAHYSCVCDRLLNITLKLVTHLA